MKNPPQPDTVPSRRRVRAGRWLLALAAPVVLLGLGEAGLRLAGFRHVPRVKRLQYPTIAGYDGTYEYRIPATPEPPGYLWRTQAGTPLTGADGFRRPELTALPAPGRFRIAFLGGSTTQGQRYPFAERTVNILNGALGPSRYEALNAGCSSYSTHQSRLALERWVLRRQPGLVCVYHGWNDWDVAVDGYSDAEKDLPATLPPLTGRVARFLAVRSRLVQGLAWGSEVLDRSWPRARVAPGEFEDNLRAMARRCARHGREVVVFTRPPRVPAPPPSSESAAHQECLDIQRRVAATESNVRLFDACRVVEDLHARRLAGEFGPGVQIHQPDGLHLRPLGEQLLAEELACFLVPGQAAVIRAWLDSPVYVLDTARRLIGEEMPREAVWILGRIPPGTPMRAEADALRAEAVRRYEFADLFWQGCWGGTDTDFESKIGKLRRCQEIRPGDLGVCRQIALVCYHMGRAGEAAAAMEGFRPADSADRAEWAWLAFHSHVAARRLSEAAEMARLRLQLDPSDAEAREFLRDFGIPPS